MPERVFTAGVWAAIQARIIRPVLFVEITYVSAGVDAYLRMFTGIGIMSWDGKTWIGGRELLSITPIRETTNPTAVGFSVKVSGMPADKLSIALQSLRKGRAGKLWLGFYDAAGALIVDPYPLRRGRFDVAPIERTGETMTIEARYEDRLVDLEQPRERRYTDQDQRIDHPDDGGFRYVEKLQDATFTWGR